MEPVLQVALDHMHLKRALLAAAEAVEGGADWLEAGTPLEELKAVASATSLPVAVAGGLNSETVAQAAAAGASILIVGGAIIKAEKVSEATRTIKKAIGSRKAIPTGSFRKYTEADVREAF